MTLNVIHPRQVTQVVQSFDFCARRLSVERYSYSDVAGWLGGWVAGCHTLVLYQNG